MSRFLSTLTPLRIFLLAVLVAGLALALQPWLALSAQTPAGPKTEQDQTTSLALSAPPALARLSQTRERPLFHAARRAPPSREETAGPPAETLVLGRYRVLGVVGVGDALAVLLRPVGEASAQTLRLAPGDRLDGWILRDLTLDGFVLEKDGTQRRFAFDGAAGRQ